MRRLFLIACMVGLAAGCGSPAKVAEAPANNDENLKTVLHDYVIEFLKRNPTVATYVGGAGLDAALRDVDGTLRDYSAGALQQEDEWLAKAKTTIDGIAPTTLSPNPRIDRDVALAQIAFHAAPASGPQLPGTRARHLRQRTVPRARLADAGHDADRGEHLRHRDEWTLVVQRVKAIPAFLQRAREQLTAGVTSNNVPDGRMLQRDGINTSEANAKYFGETLPKLASERISGPKRDRLLMPICATASKDAADAYRAMRDFVADDLFHRRAEARRR